MEKDLARAIILRTIRDLVEERGYTDDCIDFLKGQTETAIFWFDVAEVKPLKDIDRQAITKIATTLRSSMKRAKNGNVLDNC